jgi:hypothetical protein
LFGGGFGPPAFIAMLFAAIFFDAAILSGE